MKGKVADVVMSVRNGNQIVRKYQPMVYNPSTAGQVAARAKLKLLSQLSASMGKVIAMPRMGIVSPRNQFTKENYAAVTYATSAEQATASIDLASVKLTKSSVYLPDLRYSFDSDNTHAQFSLNAEFTEVDKVVYCLFSVGANNEVRLVNSLVASDSSTSFRTPMSPIVVNAKNIVYAYGIRLNSDAARAKFTSLGVDDATLIASLIASRVLTEADVTLTETKFVELQG